MELQGVTPIQLLDAILPFRPRPCFFFFLPLSPVGSSQQLTMGAATQTPPPSRRKKVKKDVLLLVPQLQNQLRFKLVLQLTVHKYGTWIE